MNRLRAYLPLQAVQPSGSTAYFGIEPKFWLNLQLRYNMKIAKSKVGKIIDREVKRHLSQTNSQNLVTV